MNKKNYIIINTANLANSTEFTYKLAKPARVKQYVKLMYACVPNTNYMLNNTNNNLIITFIDGTVRNITLPNQNYLTNELASAIKTAVNYSNFDMVFDKNLVKYQLTAGGNFYTSGNMCSVLGLEQNQFFLPGSVYAKNSIQFTNPKVLYIRINDLSNENIFTSTSKNATFFMHNDTNKNSNITYYAYQYDNIITVESNPISLSELQVQILDDNFQIYDNLNIPVQLILEFV